MPHPPRATVNPTLSRQETRRFHFLTRVQAEPELRSRFKIGSGAVFVTVFVVGIGLALRAGEQDPEAGISMIQMLMLVLVGVTIAIFTLSRHLDSDPIAQLPPGGRILPEELADPEAEHLLNLQRAVDTIVESPLHRRGLLDDTIRAQVVLRDVEWSIARQLLQQSNSRQRIDRTPVSGPQSQAAADRAHTELTRRQRATLTQIDTVTEHAQHVIDAETHVTDIASAHYLTELGSDIAEQTVTESATEADSASLASLRLAKESARRIAALAHGR